VPFAACDTPGVTLVDPDISNPNDKGTTIHVTLADSALAEALGWSQGVPNAEVVLHRFVDPFRPDTIYSDSTGRVYVTDLLPGLYWIGGYRVVTNPEQGAAIRAFGGGLKVDLPATIELEMAGDQTGSLVISELHFGGLPPVELDYPWDQYFELYNNSDSTIYLDGMLWGRAFGHSGSALYTCDELRPFREDPLGLWSVEFHQFPGAGTDYPVAPGQLVTVAMDAVDHSVAHPALPDLSRADFELTGTADPDNPDVPNMASVGLGSNLLGHGMWMSRVMFLAQAVDVTSLLIATVTGGGRWARIPADQIVDVVHSETVKLNSAPPLMAQYYCHTWVNRAFDRLDALFYRSGDSDNITSLHRRVLQYTTDGRPILQDVNASFVDFSVATLSPGRIEF
jgi:hypothetical protein